MADPAWHLPAAWGDPAWQLVRTPEPPGLAQWHEPHAAWEFWLHQLPAAPIAIHVPIPAVPEPHGLLLAALGVVGLWLWVRRG